MKNLPQNTLFHLNFAILCVLVLLLSSCQAKPQEQNPTSNLETPAPNNAVTKSQNQGPIKADVTLSNATPRLGDPVELTLRISAPQDVVVVMPVFGEQLGRFDIAGYTPSQTVDKEGNTIYEERYNLELPMSGKLRVPSFLIEFTDNRTDSENPGKLQELQTEDFSFEVASVLPQDQDLSTLKGPRPALPELKLPTQAMSRLHILLIALAVILFVAALIIFLILRRGKKHPPKLPHEIALERLSVLENAKIPSEPEAIDAWYVELSDILRHYIEARFSLSAPTLTTEEFFVLAARSDNLTQDHKRSLRQILEKSDRVKFTDYLPQEEESRAALGATRTFVDETKPIISEQPGAPH